MKILLMHRRDSDAGGGQVQMCRLHAGLKREGIEARILCRENTLEDSVAMPFRPGAERWLGKFGQRMGLNDIHLLSSSRVAALSEFREADLIDFHCLHSGTFSYLSLPALTAAKPAVFTFHDMWPLTGHCHASLDCERWKTGCGRCPYPATEPSVRRDATAVEWKLKRWAYGRSKFTIVTPSRWLHDRIRHSLLGDFPVHQIPHGVGTDVLLPLDKEHCRRMLGVPAGKRVLLAAMESMARPLKGADLLVKALDSLPKSLRQDCVLLLFGKSSEQVIKRMPMPVIDLGYLHHDCLKAVAYSAADLLVNPSRAESFGLVVLESMACGTPVASFAVGGVPELVRPGLTGLLAEPENPASLAEAIARLLDDHPARESMAHRCRETVMAEYDLKLQVRRYIDLYRAVIAGKQGHAIA